MNIFFGGCAFVASIIFGASFLSSVFSTAIAASWAWRRRWWHFRSSPTLVMLLFPIMGSLVPPRTPIPRPRTPIPAAHPWLLGPGAFLPSTGLLPHTRIANTAPSLLIIHRFLPQVLDRLAAYGWLGDISWAGLSLAGIVRFVVVDVVFGGYVVGSGLRGSLRQLISSLLLLSIFPLVSIHTGYSNWVNDEEL